jgi:hypothetical protein
MTKKKETKLLLILVHETLQSHREYWHLNKDGMIHVMVETPENYPEIWSSYDISPLQALKRYALMTSVKEGWRIKEIQEVEENWYKWVESLDISKLEEQAKLYRLL